MNKKPILNPSQREGLLKALDACPACEIGEGLGEADKAATASPVESLRYE